MNTKYWIGVASKDHIDIGVEGGFMQLCHGRLAPLKKINKDDRILYYSPNRIYKKKDKLQSFTACGTVTDNNIYKVKIGEEFEPWRRDVKFDKDIKPVKIKPIINELSFIKNKDKWGVYFRSGIIEIKKEDYEVIIRELNQK